MYTRMVNLKKLLISSLFLYSCFFAYTHAQTPDPHCASAVPGSTDYIKYNCKGEDTNRCAGLVPGSQKYIEYGCKAEDGGNTNNTTVNTSSSFDLNIKLQNPLKATTIQEAIALFMRIIIKLAIPVIILMYLWVGFSYILALGNPEKIKKVHNLLLYTVIGTLLVFGAWAITNAIVGTINAVIAP